MTNVRHFRSGELPFKLTTVDSSHTSICRAIGGDISTTMGAGIEKLDRVNIEWTVSYDEILFIKEGEVIINSGGKRHHCAAGDIVWLPNGTSLIYEVADTCTYFYALFPVDWAKRQGIQEP